MGYDKLQFARPGASRRSATAALSAVLQDAHRPIAISFAKRAQTGFESSRVHERVTTVPFDADVPRTSIVVHDAIGDAAEQRLHVIERVPKVRANRAGSNRRWAGGPNRVFDPFDHSDAGAELISSKSSEGAAGGHRGLTIGLGIARTDVFMAGDCALPSTVCKRGALRKLAANRRNASSPSRVPQEAPAPQTSLPITPPNGIA